MSYQLVTIGNPNSGKTSLFNALTGSRQHVGNWSGVTVDKKVGRFRAGGHDYELVDLPGIYALESRDCSVDELVSYHYLMNNRPDLVVNVVDASCLERSLYLTLQLRELGLPVVVVLNKLDVIRHRGLKLDEASLARALGCPVVSLSARNAKQTAQLKRDMHRYLESEQQPLVLDYGSEVETSARKIAMLLEGEPCLDKRGIALQQLESGCQPCQWLNETGRDQAINLYNKLHVTLDLDLHFADVRYQFIHQYCAPCIKHPARLSTSVSEKLDRLFLNRYLGIPLFLAVMYLMFLFAINVGSAFIDFFDQIGQLFLVDGVKQGLGAIGAPTWLSTIAGDGIGTGIQTVLTFIPVIGCLYLFLAFLESSGYLARAAFVVDRLMRRIGLPGKAFVPMLVGFGCNVPALMSVRTLSAERERLTTSAMIPFMSCGARLPVYALFAVAFFPQSGQNLVFILYLLGIAVAVLTGLLLRKTILPGVSGSLVMEMPDYELPRLKDVALKTHHKLKSFIFGAGKTIVLVVAVLSVLNSLGTDGSFGHQNSERSLLSYVSQRVTPVFAPLGIEQDNWQATVGIVTGVFAKESVVGTLNSLYANQQEEQSQALDIWPRVKAAFATIPQNLAAINLSDPLGLKVGDTENQQEAASEQDVSQRTFGSMQQHFDGKHGAFAYLLFILLYMPCAAAMGALVRETGRRWALFVALWCNFTAYFSSVLYYQLTTLSQHPLQSLGWLVLFILLITLMWWQLKRRGDILTREALSL
ncbi:Fe(2+) transporter permease subunit FeoB [Dongshaea marina]|uniref:Fe(2+) transporter permease subunit FeoB n=1 Tax=Dongshaea marina TaxID=2047966 RepID=UPI000D3E59E6|nr:Fe(2+) transporter permease subunit FeoB [Dongshaea marina]